MIQPTPLHVQPLGKTSEAVTVEDQSFSVEFVEFILQTWTEMVAESFLNMQHKKIIPMLDIGCLSACIMSQTFSD